MADVDIFTNYRPRLFGLAYRMLGSVMDAEDIVQEAYLRWQQVSGAMVDEPRAYLTTVVTRLCIDHLRSARVRREQYVGPWLPEPLVTDQAPEPSNAPALAESLSMAFLVLLETLTPQERAVFLLHEVFGYSFTEIATVIGKSEANCRQIAGRARKHVEGRRPRFDASRDQQERLLHRFVKACTTGDMDALLSVLADDVTLWADGGGKVQAALEPIHGAAKVARGALTVLAKAPPGLTFRFALVNGQPGIVAEIDGQPYSVLTFDVVGDRIQTIRSVANPDKLTTRLHQLC
jgi:RNA polymerase sigma-70 factor (ECF subfamily)